jgi:hypothetical protein
VVHSKERVPSVILYHERQVEDLRRFCFDMDVGSVLSFDKTYNLGAFFVTPSVYTHKALLRKTTQEEPIFLGPIFLHGHSDFATYATFFSHIAAKLVDSDSTKLVLGSDEEAAMRKALTHAFPRARLVVCSRHMK